MNEATVSPSLGLLGGAGFLTLVLVGIIGPIRLIRRGRTIVNLCRLNYALLFFTLIGGFGEIVALRDDDDTLLSLCQHFHRILLPHRLGDIRRQFKRNVGRAHPGSRSIWLALLWVVTVLGLLDQIPSMLTPNHDRDEKMFRSDREFVSRIDGDVPAGSMIFQLPAVSFPEAGPHVQMYDYVLFRGYLHSNRLRWSYGAIRGREVENSTPALRACPLRPSLDELSEAGVRGHLREPQRI